MPMSGNVECEFRDSKEISEYSLKDHMRASCEYRSKQEGYDNVLNCGFRDHRMKINNVFRESKSKCRRNTESY